MTALIAACHQNNWQACGVIQDTGYSSRNLNRPGLTKLVQLVETGEIDGILCTHPDRLCRSAYFQKMVEEFKLHSVSVIPLHQWPNMNLPD